MAPQDRDSQFDLHEDLLAVEPQDSVRTCARSAWENDTTHVMQLVFLPRAHLDQPYICNP